MNRPTPEQDLVWLPVPDYPADAFVGTARYYAQYRPPYPQALLDDLCTRAAITGNGRLLDLGCGPGRIAIALAARFQETWAVDPEPEMIEVGREEAGRRGVADIRWITGKAETLEAPSASFELITIGEAFHRMDQRIITRQVIRWLPPGGCLAMPGGYEVFKGDEPWQKLGAEVKARWADKRRIAETNTPDLPRGPDYTTGVLQAAGFVDVTSCEFEQPFTWTLDAVVGNIFSSSAWSQRILGDRAEAFEADLRRTLLDYDAGGRYPATLSFGYTFGRTPEN